LEAEARRLGVVTMSLGGSDGAWDTGWFEAGWSEAGGDGR
jgi:hypothetical protein